MSAYLSLQVAEKAYLKLQTYKNNSMEMNKGGMLQFQHFLGTRLQFNRIVEFLSLSRNIARMQTPRLVLD